jgi:hypothetical protein
MVRESRFLAFFVACLQSGKHQGRAVVGALNEGVEMSASVYYHRRGTTRRALLPNERLSKKTAFPSLCRGGSIDA